MKEINIKSSIKNYEDEDVVIETKGNYDIENNIIEYRENDLKVKINLSGEKIILDRRNDEYNLSLEFQKENKIKSRYEVKSIGLKLDIEVYTDLLEVKDNEVLIKYEIFDGEREIGKFEYQLLYWE